MRREQNSTQHNQRGLVLFITLVSLVVMSLAAVALIRSVDTNTMIAGNLSFKQSALTSADRGIESAITWINQTASTNSGDLNSSDGAKGYYAVYGDLGLNAATPAINIDNTAILKSATTWTNYSHQATGTKITNGTEDETRNTIAYIIERMCTNELAPANDAHNKCLMGAAGAGAGQVGGNSKNVKTSEEAGATIIAPKTTPVFYRVTVRVTGPKNTQAYSQAYVY